MGNSARDGDVIPRITTNVAHISVAPTGGTEGSPLPTVPPTVEEQLRADMGNLADLTTEDKSSLVAAINEVRQTGGGGVQSDWNQNDETQLDYIKNRPFYTGDPVETVLVEESTVSFAEDRGLYGAQIQSSFSATVGETYKVYWDGAAYECVCVNLHDTPIIGNLSIIGDGSDTGEPFVMGILNGEGIQIVTADTSASHTVSISAIVSVVKIDEKYLPNTVATKSEVEVAQTTANNAQTAPDNAQSKANAAKTTAENAQTTADNAQSKANTAKTIAENAQSTANAAQSKAESIKPNWNENNSSKPGYIANRPFYHDIITAEIPVGRQTASANLLIDGTELYWSGLVSNLTGLLQIDGNKIYMLDGTLEKFTPVFFRTGVNSYSYDYALGNPHLIKAKLPSAKDAHGGELPDTGGDWVYYHTPGSSTVVTISKTNRWYGTFVEFLSEDLKLLDEKFIPASIQRTGGEVFLHSSTAGSTKQFRITVDDSGTLTATEVS